MKHERFKRILALAAASGLVVCGALAPLGASAQGSAIVVLPLDPVSKTTHGANRRAFAPRMYVAVPHRPVLFLIGNSAEEVDESYDDTDDEFDVADTDNDGFISFREARRANPEWAKHFNRIDTSGDGFLTREEIEAFSVFSHPVPSIKTN
ncbi:MAG: EF-hand domain-containing protein [Betaproteobacteria bacterium]|nr:MAG: EF-hand domain-containing protein [Betaproteobacteria bacterium]